VPCLTGNQQVVQQPFALNERVIFRKQRQHAVDLCIVLQAVDRKDGSIIALKKIRLEQEEEGIPSTAIREISLLKELAQCNVVRCGSLFHCCQAS
jgi:hypothetical protein